MLSKDLQFLTNEAKRLMAKSRDTVHDIHHVKRVVEYTHKLSEKNVKNQNYKDALVLAAWWHDVGRIINKKTSLVVMPFFDDALSAFMLWYAAIQHGYMNKHVWLAGRILLCKSLGTGTILTKIFLLKRTRHLRHIIKDADALDVLRIERIQLTIPLVNESSIYYFGYKTSIHWWLKQLRVSIKTVEARKYLEELIIKLLQWIKEPRIYNWHLEMFGKKWCDKIFSRTYKLLDEITLLNLQTA